MFYLTSRMHFICREENKIIAQKKKLKKDKSKQSKL